MYYFLHVIVAHDSPVFSRGIRFTTVSNVACVHDSVAGADAKSIQCDEVEFEFADSSAAQEFRATIAEAKKSMLVQYLQGTRHCDLVVYEREMGDIVIGHFVLSNAQLKIIRDLSTDGHRMILLRRDRTGSACFELTEDFLGRLTEESRPRTRTYVGQFASVQEDGVRVVEQSIEVGLLLPLDNDLELALRPA